MNCPLCKNALWNPFAACEKCGYSIRFTLENPSSYQAGQKWPKHGLLYTGSETIVDPMAWGKTPGTKFISTFELTKSFETVAASGNILIPKGGARDESYIFYIGSVTGGGLLGGSWQDFYAIRLVRPNDFDEIHIFPMSDQRLTKKLYAGVAGKPMLCRRGRNSVNVVICSAGSD